MNNHLFERICLSINSNDPLNCREIEMQQLFLDVKQGNFVEFLPDRMQTNCNKKKKYHVEIKKTTPFTLTLFFLETQFFLYQNFSFHG